MVDLLAVLLYLWTTCESFRMEVFVRSHFPVAVQEFQNRGVRSRRCRILRSGVCFDAPSHIPYIFVVRVVNKILFVNIVC